MMTYIAFFVGDKAVFSDWDRGYLEDMLTSPDENPPTRLYPFEAQPGEFLVLLGVVDEVGGNRLGLCSVRAVKLVVKEPLRRGSGRYVSFAVAEAAGLRELNCVAINAMPKHLQVKQQLELAPQALDVLSDQQCRHLTRCLQSHENGWAWNNATQEAKAALRAAYSGEDKARELARKGAQHWLDTKDVRASQQLIEEALDLYPGLEGARFDLGKIALEAGAVDDAIRWLQGELRLAQSPRHLTTHMFLAEIYSRLGNREAEETHRRAIVEIESRRSAWQRTELAPDAVEVIRRAVGRTGAAQSPAPDLSNSQTGLTPSRTMAWALAGLLAVGGVLILVFLVLKALAAR